MKKYFIYKIITCFVFVTAIFSCKKEPVNRIVPNNNAPDYHGVPTIKVKNYVNKLFIDLIGREPLDSEMDSLVDLLEMNNLKFEIRDSIIIHLTKDTIVQANGDSFKFLYFSKLHDLQKSRLLEGVPDSEFLNQANSEKGNAKIDSINGDIISYHYKMNQARLYESVVNSKEEYLNNLISFEEVCLRMCYNPIYDEINMNSFNYINAVFDNLYYRVPTQQEFNESYKIVDANRPGVLLGKAGENKLDFIKIITADNEFIDGTIIWIFRTYLARNPTMQELYVYSEYYQSSKNIHYAIKEVLKTDEYAGL